MKHATYDLIVIGSGPAGETGAAQAAHFGKSGGARGDDPRGDLLHLRRYVLQLSDLYKYATYDAMGRMDRGDVFRPSA